MWYDATMVVTFGNITNSGTSKIKATKGGKQVEFAKRTKIQVDKNHINGITTRGNIVMTTHGFLLDDKKAIDDYKKKHSEYWLTTLGSTDFELVEEGSMEEDIRDLGIGTEFMQEM